MTYPTFKSVLQLSDTHILAQGERFSAELDTTVYLQQAIGQISRLEHQPRAMIISGDLVDRGSYEAYAHFRQLIATIGVPVYLAMGNHDSRSHFLDVFPEYLQHEWIRQTGFIQYAAQIDQIRLVVLDSSVSGQSYGLLCEKRLAWLERTLAQKPQVPTVLVLHHPPFLTGVAHMDACGLRGGAEDLRQIILHNPQVQRIVCGHVHRFCTQTFAGTIGMVGPSCAHQIAFQLDRSHPNAFTLEPPGYLLHIWDAAATQDRLQLISHLLALGDYGGQHSF